MKSLLQQERKALKRCEELRDSLYQNYVEKLMTEREYMTMKERYTSETEAHSDRIKELEQQIEAAKRSNTKVRNYSCDTPRFTDEYECSSEHIPEEDIMDAILTTLRAYARLAVDLDQILLQQQEQARLDRKQLQRKLMVLQSKKEQTERRLQDMYEVFFEGSIGKNEYVSRKQALSGQLTQIAEEIDALDAALSTEQDSKASSIISKYKSYAGIDDLAEANLRELLDRVTIYPNGVLRVRLNFCDELESIAESLKLSCFTA